MAGITAYDAYQVLRGRGGGDSETMSQCWARWLRHRVGRPACIIVWTGITIHLFWAVVGRE